MNQIISKNVCKNIYNCVINNINTLEKNEFNILLILSIYYFNLFLYVFIYNF